MSPTLTARTWAAAGSPARSPIRVLQLIDTLGVGGAQQLLITLAQHLDRHRFDLRVCSLAPIGESPIARDLRAAGVPVESLGGVRLRDPRDTARLAALIRGRRIDVVHTHLGLADTMGVLAARLAGRRAVSTLHNVHDVYTSHGFLRQALRGAALTMGTHRVIACAPEVLDAARKRYHVSGHAPGTRWVVVPNGIPLDASARINPAAVATCRRELLGTGNGPLVLAVGALRASKGHAHLIDAAALLREQLPDSRVVIVGDNEGERAPLLARIDRLGMGGTVILGGRRRDIPALLAACDVFVLPSLYEGLPLALLEAMAAGKPVVATAVGGVPGVVTDGVTGWLVPPADGPALAGALSGALRSADPGRRVAQAGCDHVRRTYGAAAWATRLQEIYLDAAVRGVCAR